MGRMTRTEDPPGAVKHLRFRKMADTMADIIRGFPGVKAIVLHTHGKKGEHPHFHVWYDGEEVTNQTVRNRLKAYNPLFQQCKSQNDWSMRNHNDWDTWSKYVTANGSHSVLMDYQDLMTKSQAAQAAVPIVAVPFTESPLHTTTAIVRVLPKKRLTSEERLIAYCEALGWTQNSEFTLDKYDNGTAQKLCREHTVAYTNGRCAAGPTGEILARNMLYLFADDDLRDVLKERFSKKWDLG